MGDLPAGKPGEHQVKHHQAGLGDFLQRLKTVGGLEYLVAFLLEVGPQDLANCWVIIYHEHSSQSDTSFKIGDRPLNLIVAQRIRLV